MDTIVVQPRAVALEASEPVQKVGSVINPNLKPTQNDEDDSSLSSTGTEVFDRNKTDSTKRPGTWEVDGAGNWQRYGSLESATSTGISSICSSTPPDGLPSETKVALTPSKKRLSDGTVKQPTIRLSARSSLSIAATHQAEISVLPSESPSKPQPPPKRRGRPPKDKSIVSGSVPKVRRPSTISRLQDEVRPRSSIPHHIPNGTFARQCIEAAQASRLDAYALHAGEHALLVDLITSDEVTVYLNIRNAIVRLWIRNPLAAVTPEEAAGCAKEARFFGLAEIAYKWLTRNGYINFGCVEVPKDVTMINRMKTNKQKTVVVIGAGVSGLTTARQLEGLFAQNAQHWLERGEKPPRVVILEGRKRIGGRVFSKPLRSQVTGSLPDDLRNTAEMGAMIVTGFEHGNPLDVIIRGQLGLRYHLMTDALTIYDINGKPVDETRDMLNTELYTDISDRAGDFRAGPRRQDTLKGDEDLIDRCRDPVPNGFATFQLEPLPTLDGQKQRKPVSKRGRRRNAPPGTEKLTGRSQVIEGSSATVRAARAAHQMGWQVRDGVSKNHTVSLRSIADAKDYPTLGEVMDEAISQYQGLLEMNRLDMRLLNWHHANLEYANAAPVTRLSLSGHDQDNGNEFEGAHSEVIGGYTQLPRGLMNLPTRLDVRFDRVVDSIHYDGGDERNPEVKTKIVCTDGEVIEADEVVVTAPLGVLKANVIDFDPPLPDWKCGAISRMGFGLLNKVILLYDAPFWDESRDMFGLLNEAEQRDSMDPVQYEKRRGRFYLIWNASKISGRPMLIALMAGHAAYETETTDTNTLLAEVTERLRQVFTPNVPAPREVIVTRWKRDPFSRGTYSYVGPRTEPGDYDVMAKPVGNLHFAGEATCGTHPATVHGAFLSGLRVAADVMQSMTGPIRLPEPLVGQATVKQENVPTHTYSSAVASRAAPTSYSGSAAEDTVAGAKIKAEPDSVDAAAIAPSTAPYRLAGAPLRSVCSSDPSFWAMASYDNSDLNYEATVVAIILSQIGERPSKPTRAGVNPFLLFTKAKWDECKEHCSGSTDSSAGRNLIRQTLGQWWKGLDEEAKKPYLEQSQAAQQEADSTRKVWEQDVAMWDEEAKRIRREYMRENPAPAASGGRRA